jgi:DNA-binding transcriptional LysR family regulator
VYISLSERLSLRQIRYFLVAADELHFGRASSRLYVTQPALSYQMRALEEIVGTPLFTRTQRGVELTRAGAAFQTELRRVVAATEAAVEVARRAASAPEPLIRVCYDETIEWLFLGHLLGALADCGRRDDAVWLPRLEEVRPDELLTGHYDVALTRHFVGANGLAARVLAWERPALYVSRASRYATEAEISLASLHDVEMRVISPDLAPERYRATLCALEQAGVGVTPIAAHNLPAAEVARGIAEGAYVMIGLASATGRFPEIVTVPLAPPAAPVPVTLVTRADDQRAAIRELTETVLRVVSEHETAHWRADAP